MTERIFALEKPAADQKTSKKDQTYVFHAKQIREDANRRVAQDFKEEVGHSKQKRVKYDR